MLAPALTLAALTGPGHAYVPVAPAGGVRWGVSGPGLWDAYTGAHLAVVGDMPALCHAGAATPRVRALLERSGVALPDALVTYACAGTRGAALRTLARAERRMVLQLANDGPEFDACPRWIDAALQSWLNNKANLPELVPARATPERRVARPSELRARPPAVPCVLKVASDSSASGGASVRLCRTEADRDAAFDALAGADLIVAERYYGFADTFCLHVAVGRDGGTRYLGAARQVVDAAGRYKGNWLEADGGVPQAAVEDALATAAAGAARGFYGLAGFDTGLTADGGHLIFDLNFRLNGSTPAVLLADAVRTQHPGAAMRFLYLEHRGTFDEMAAGAAPFVRDGRVRVLSAFDPDSDAPTRLSALVVGDGRGDVDATLNTMSASGFCAG